jgi:uncharacterized membrane protein YtjA (UPF0391 family)
MLPFFLVFLILALMAALLGFGLLGGISLGAAKLLFGIFLFLALLSYLYEGFRSPSL